MFCDACGAALQPDQKFCPKCGKPVLGTIVPGGGRVAQHAHLLGILWLIYSVLHAFGGFALLIVANTIFRHMGAFMRPGEEIPPQVPMFLHPLLSFIGLLLLVKGLAGVAAGIGLMQRQGWARMLAIVLGVISLINIPLGTALGIYTFWVLLSPNAEQEYRQMARASA